MDNEYILGLCKNCGQTLGSHKQKYCSQLCSEKFRAYKKANNNTFHCRLCQEYRLNQLFESEFKFNNISTRRSIYLCKLHKEEMEFFIKAVLPGAGLKIQSLKQKLER